MGKRIKGREFAREWMGRVALVKAEMRCAYTHHPAVVNPLPGGKWDDGMTVRAWTRHPCKEWRAGWVIGLRFVVDGVVEPARGPTNDDGDREGPYLAETARHAVVLVSYWPTEAPVRVSLDDIIRVDEEGPLWGAMAPMHEDRSVNGARPYPSGGYGARWEDRRVARNSQSQMARGTERPGDAPFARDERGRFMKERRT